VRPLPIPFTLSRARNEIWGQANSDAEHETGFAGIKLAAAKHRRQGKETTCVRFHWFPGVTPSSQPKSIKKSRNFNFSVKVPQVVAQKKNESGILFLNPAIFKMRIAGKNIIPVDKTLFSYIILVRYNVATQKRR
jgi:hypothetical protein